MLPVQLCDLWPISVQYAHGACSVWSSASENSSKPTRSPLCGNLPPKKKPVLSRFVLKVYTFMYTCLGGLFFFFTNFGIYLPRVS